jgi:biofilm PGA synthesis N-glycosyltransferase PgaC
MFTGAKDLQAGTHSAVQFLAAEAPAASRHVCACSVGIMAYNEEANIAAAIEAVLEHPLVAGELTELIVVASGCTDRTSEIVSAIARVDSRVHLIEQERREGKASAINVFIAAAQSPVLVMVGADVLVEDGTIARLLRHFENPSTGMVGGHPIPVNDEGTLLGHAVHLLWRLHDQLAQESPKLGEIVAFRNIVPSIPVDTPVDEISIQALVTQLGYELVYEPEAVVYNRGPATIGDYLRQRRRIYAGHLRIRKQQQYAASTMSVGRVVRVLLRSHSFSTPRTACWTLATVALEALARALGYYDYLRRQPHHIWESVATTKRDIPDGVNAYLLQNVLVFHIVDFHRHQLEMGVRASRRLTQQVTDRLEQAFERKIAVSAQRNGTIVAFLAGARDKAEATALRIVEGFDGEPLTSNGSSGTTSVRLTCGIIAFSQGGTPVTTAIRAQAHDSKPRVLVASREASPS